MMTFKRFLTELFVIPTAGSNEPCLLELSEYCNFDQELKIIDECQDWRFLFSQRYRQSYTTTFSLAYALYRAVYFNHDKKETVIVCENRSEQSLLVLKFINILFANEKTLKYKHSIKKEDGISTTISITAHMFTSEITFMLFDYKKKHQFLGYRIRNIDLDVLIPSNPYGQSYNNITAPLYVNLNKNSGKELAMASGPINNSTVYDNMIYTATFIDKAYKVSYNAIEAGVPEDKLIYMYKVFNRDGRLFYQEMMCGRPEDYNPSLLPDCIKQCK